jgi:hypothetical protein
MKKEILQTRQFKEGKMKNSNLGLGTPSNLLKSI